MEIPAPLVEAVRQGRVVLFLGAGASFGAKDADGTNAPSGKELAEWLSDKFLAGQFKDRSLATIAELAASESDERTVQDFIASRLRDLQPAPFHLLIPTFRWHGIATTNFDLVIEESYRANKDRVQDLATFISGADRIEDKIRSSDHLLLIKLHGCITRTADPDLPLILTVDQYVNHRSKRRRLFQTFEGWAHELPVVFVGQDLVDADIRQMLLTLEDELEQYRPRYYLVRPNLQDAERRLWERRKVDVLGGTFQEFLEALDREIPKSLRPLLSEVRTSHPLEARFKTATEMSSSLRSALSRNLEYVYSGMPTGGGTARGFYRGFDLGWYPIEEKLDVRRHLVDKLLLEVVLADESERPSKVELHVIQGAAGAGKSTLLRRLAWDTQFEADALALFLRANRGIAYEPIREICNAVQERVFLFVDDAAEHVQEIAMIVQKARVDEVPLTVFTAESYNFWEMYCGRLGDLVTEAHELRNLSHSEIEALVELLARHDSLGPRLSRMERSKQIEEFAEGADRQLLVALHEATLGEPFEQIIEEEFRGIKPREAQSLYLTVSVLNRLRVPVRAGLISRVHGIAFERFREEFLAPLNHVVRATMDNIVKDYVYQARHPEIAEMVFQRILTKPEDRFSEYSRILAEMNIAYLTDEKAFEGMMKGRHIAELFPDYQDANTVFDLAEVLAPDSSYLLHQRALFEMHRPNSSPDKAYAYLDRAWELDKGNPVLTHSFAELALKQAERAESPLRREKYWDRAAELAASILETPHSGRYARHTLIKVYLSRLQVALRDGAPTRAIEDLIGQIEAHLEKGYQASPDDPYLVSSEAELHDLLQASDEALEALRSGFEANPRDQYLGIRLARAYEASGQIDEAIAVVKKALKAKRSDQRLNFRMAMLLRKKAPVDAELALYHLKRSFTPGDSNFEAQFWYARYAFESGEVEARREAKTLFASLRDAPIPYERRIEIRDVSGGEDAPTQYVGTVCRQEESYGFVELDGDQEWLFLHASNIGSAAWDQLEVGMRVSCAVGYTLKGPVALNLKPL